MEEEEEEEGEEGWKDAEFMMIERGRLCQSTLVNGRRGGNNYLAKNKSRAERNSVERRFGCQLTVLEELTVRVDQRL